MKEGKVSQAVLERSIIRSIKNKNDNIIKGAQIGGDVSLLCSDSEEIIAVTTRSAVLDDMNKSGEGYFSKLEYCFVNLVNHIVCGNAKPKNLMVSIVFPQKSEEKYLKQIMKNLNSLCEDNGMYITGGNTQVSSAVEYPVITLTCIGFSQFNREDKRDIANKNTANKDIVNKDIVVTGNVGAFGTAIAAVEYKDVLNKKLPKHLIASAIEFSKESIAAKAALSAYENGALAMHDAAEGGIFAALWEFAYANKVGITVDVKKLPIKQETVEICEVLQINPYEFVSTGVLVIAADNGKELCRILKDKKIDAVVVGRTTDTKDRVLINDEEKRFLNPANQDYIYKMKSE